MAAMDLHDTSTRARLERILVQRERMLDNVHGWASLDQLGALGSTGPLRAEIHHLRTILTALS